MNPSRYRAALFSHAYEDDDDTQDATDINHSYHKIQINSQVSQNQIQMEYSSQMTKQYSYPSANNLNLSNQDKQTPKKFNRLKKVSQNIAQCGVCFQDIKLNSSQIQFIKLQECSHIFCQNCFLNWAQNNNTCPMCRILCKNYTKSNGEYIELVVINTPCQVCDEIQPLDQLLTCKTCSKYYCHSYCNLDKNGFKKSRRQCKKCRNKTKYRIFF